MIKVGCCGFSGGMKDYFTRFRLVEIQQTFYRLPLPGTTKRWRESAPPDFEFTLKALQVITHPSTSPTWKRAGILDKLKNQDRYGLLRPTEENFKAWQDTKAIAEILRSKVCVFQCPPAFQLNDENERNMKTFFDAIDRGRILIAWEPRHESWYRNPSKINELCDALNLIHVVDLLKREPVSSHPTGYLRLNGLGGEINYSYRYTDEDLRNLRNETERLEKKEIYVLFNNVFMKEDAQRFMKMV